MLRYSYSKGREVHDMYTMKYLENTVDFVLYSLSKVNTEVLTAKGKYDILVLTAEKQAIIMNSFADFGKATKDYENKRIIFADGTSISMAEVERIEKLLLRARFELVDLQKKLLGVDDLMLEGMDAVNRLKAEII